MAFTLKITPKGLFGPRKINVETLLKDCGMQYGSDNEFHILEEGKIVQDTAILYNPRRMGRGIFINLHENEKGSLTLSYNIPTTASEIDDFINLAQAIVKQVKKAELYCVEEERNFTVSELQDNRENMIEFSLSTLNNFCQNQNYKSYIFTLAKWPLVLTDEQAEEFAHCRNLDNFEQLLHEKQCMDVYYAKPKLLQNNNTGRIGAFYVLTEECESIFPIHGDWFFNLNTQDLKIEDKMIQFFIYSENRIMDGLFDYEKFSEYILQHGAEPYDKEHMLIPPLNKAQLEAMAKEIQGGSL